MFTDKIDSGTCIKVVSILTSGVSYFYMHVQYFI